MHLLDCKLHSYRNFSFIDSLLTNKGNTLFAYSYQPKNFFDIPTTDEVILKIKFYCFFCNFSLVVHVSSVSALKAITASSRLKLLVTLFRHNPSSVPTLRSSSHEVWFIFSSKVSVTYFCTLHNVT